jgi:hypothetical protein
VPLHLFLSLHTGLFIFSFKPNAFWAVFLQLHHITKPLKYVAKSIYSLLIFTVLLFFYQSFFLSLLIFFVIVKDPCKQYCS